MCTVRDGTSSRFVSQFFPMLFGVPLARAEWWHDSPARTNGSGPKLGVSADHLGNVFVSGYTQGNLGGPNMGDFDAFLSKYNASGNLLWSREFGTSGYEENQGLSADGLGNVYISGSTNGSLNGANAGGSDAYVGKYDVAGNQLWLRQFGSTNTEWGRIVSADSTGNVYAAGTTAGSIGGPNAGSYDTYLRKCDAVRGCSLARQLGSAAVDVSFAVSVTFGKRIYIGLHLGQRSLAQRLAQPTRLSASMTRPELSVGLDNSGPAPTTRATASPPTRSAMFMSLVIRRAAWAAQARGAPTLSCSNTTRPATSSGRDNWGRGRKTQARRFLWMAWEMRLSQERPGEAWADPMPDSMTPMSPNTTPAGT